LLETDLRTYLLSFDSLKNKIGNRLYPVWIPQNAEMPSVAYVEVSRPSHHDIDVAFPRIQFSVFSNRYIEAKEISKEIRKILQRFKGKMGNTTVIQIAYENEYEVYERDTNRYHVATDYKIIHWE